MNWRHAKTLASLGAPLSLPLHCVQGRTAASDDHVVMLCAASEPAADFVAGALLDKFDRTDVGRLASPLDLHGRTFDRLSADADLVVIEVPPAWQPCLPGDTHWRMPAWISQELRATGDAPLVLPRLLQKEVRRQSRRHGYELRFTESAGDIERFHATLYRPYVEARFESGAVLVDEQDFFAVSRGMTLAILTVGDEWVAALLLDQRGTVLHLGWFGSATVPRPGASEVLDARVIEWAADRGATRVVMGHSRPSLANGVVRYKSRFGAGVQPTRFPQRTIALSLRRRAPALVASIDAARFVAFRDGKAVEFTPGAAA